MGTSTHALALGTGAGPHWEPHATSLQVTKGSHWEGVMARNHNQLMTQQPPHWSFLHSDLFEDIRKIKLVSLTQIWWLLGLCLTIFLSLTWETMMFGNKIFKMSKFWMTKKRFTGCSHRNWWLNWGIQGTKNLGWHFSTKKILKDREQWILSLGAWRHSLLSGSPYSCILLYTRPMFILMGIL